MSHPVIVKRACNKYEWISHLNIRITPVNIGGFIESPPHGRILIVTARLRHLQVLQVWSLLCETTQVLGLPTNTLHSSRPPFHFLHPRTAKNNYAIHLLSGSLSLDVGFTDGKD